MGSKRVRPGPIGTFMGIQKVRSLQADATVCGQTRVVEWDIADGVFTISGIRSFPEMVEVLDRLGEGGVSEAHLAPDEVVGQEDHRQEVAEAAEEVHRAVTAGQVPLAMPVTQPTKAGEVRPHFDLPASEKTPPKGEAATPSSSTVKTAASSESSPSSSPAGGEDLSVFANMAKFAEVVAEVRKRVAADDYVAIMAYCKKLQDIGDVCAPLDQLGARLEERLKTHLAGKGVTVPL